MKYANIKRLVESSYGEVGDILSYVLNSLEEDGDYEIEDLYDYIIQEVDNYFTYYEDAWNYLESNSITEFDEAIQEWQVTNVCGIACYYLTQEVEDYLNDEWAYYDEDDEEEDE